MFTLASYVQGFLCEEVFTTVGLYLGRQRGAHVSESSASPSKRVLDALVKSSDKEIFVTEFPDEVC